MGGEVEERVEIIKALAEERKRNDELIRILEGKVKHTEHDKAT